MNWFTLTILSIIFGSIATIYQRLLMKKQDSHPIAFMIFFQFFITALLGTYIIFSKTKIPNLIPILPYSLVAGSLIAIGSITMFKALKETEASEYVILNNSSVFWGLMASAIFLNEVITPNKIYGSLFIILGIISIIWKTKKINLLFTKDTLIH